MNRAYEVLKDEDLRKKYDKYGEKGLDEQQQGGRYESWNYYRYDFGKFSPSTPAICNHGDATRAFVLFVFFMTVCVETRIEHYNFETTN